MRLGPLGWSAKHASIRHQALKTKSPETEILKQAEKETEIRRWISIISIKHCRWVSQQEDNGVYPSLACLKCLDGLSNQTPRVRAL
jgi:hypothetical protein